MDVKVTATGLADGSTDWDIDGKKPKNSRIEFAPKSGPHVVVFKLFDGSKRDLRFDCAGPIWSHESETDCPPKGATCDQITVRKCSERELEIRNANSGDARIIHYQLNFVDGSEKPEPVDPEFKNGGSG